MTQKIIWCTEWGKILANHIFCHGLVTKIYFFKNSQNPTVKGHTQLSSKMDKIYEKVFHQRGHRDGR